jgi:hypothetical protein
MRYGAVAVRPSIACHKAEKGLDKMSLRKFALAGASVLALGVGSVQAAPVALELVLAIDVSGSIDASEYNLQLQGYAAAFNNPTVQNAIASFQGGIAVAVVQFSTGAQTAIGWTNLTTQSEVAQFATDLGSMVRLSSGSTGIAQGMAASIALITDATFDGRRKVIDVSGDGLENVDDDTAVQTQRNAAAAAGITVNGLAIEGDFGPSGVTDFYTANVVTAGGFVVTATSFDDFESAATTKIGREIIGVPEPMSLTLFGLGLAGLGLIRRRAA